MMGHEFTMGVSSIRLVQKQQNIFGCISFWSVALQGHPVQQTGGVHDWLIQTLVSTVQRGTLVQPDADACTLRRTLCILYTVECAASVVDLERHW